MRTLRSSSVGARLAALAVVALAPACGGPGGDAPGLTELLANAQPGDVITLEERRYEGSWTVPAGVSLVGAGRGKTVLAGSGRRAVLSVVPSAMPAKIMGLTIDSDATVGLMAAGDGTGGQLEVLDSDLVARRGAALAVERAGLVSLRGVVIAPPEGDATACGQPDAGPFVGVLAHETDVATDDAEIRGFACGGLVAAGGQVLLSRTNVVGNRGHGVLLDGVANGGFITVSVDGTLGPDGAGVALVGGTKLMSIQELSSSNNEGLGLFVDGAAIVSSAGLSFLANKAGGIWVQNQAGPVILRGSFEAVKGNGRVGIVVHGATDVTISGLGVASTTASPDQPNSGDGIQLVNPTGRVHIENLAVERNARVGIFVASAGVGSSVVFANVTVFTEAGQLGYIDENGGILAAGSSTGVARTGTAESADAACCSSPLPTLGKLAAPQAASRGVGVFGAGGVLDGYIDENGGKPVR